MQMPNLLLSFTQNKNCLNPRFNGLTGLAVWCLLSSLTNYLLSTLTSDLYHLITVYVQVAKKKRKNIGQHLYVLYLLLSTSLSSVCK